MNISIHFQVLQENQYRTVYEDTNGAGSQATCLNEPDSTIAVSQLSPHASKKKHGHRRKRSKGRTPKIANIEDTLEDNYTSRSLGKSCSFLYTQHKNSSFLYSKYSKVVKGIIILVWGCLSNHTSICLFFWSFVPQFVWSSVHFYLFALHFNLIIEYRRYVS